MAGPSDQFAGAEQAIDQQRLSALATIAQFGRRGLEEGVLTARGYKSREEAVNLAAQNLAKEFGVGDEVTAGGNSVYAPYHADAARANARFAEEDQAAQQANSTFYTQAREAVPQLRTQAQQIVQEYKAAYDERQAEVRAEAAQRAEQARQFAAQLAAQQQESALNIQLQRERLSGDATLANLALQTAVASRPYDPGPAPRPMSERVGGAGSAIGSAIGSLAGRLRR